MSESVPFEVLPQHTASCRSYWQGRPSELARRWASFVGISAPWLTRLANAFLQGRLTDEATQAALASDAVENFQRLGPTFVKIGQVASVRYVPPDAELTPVRPSRSVENH